MQNGSKLKLRILMVAIGMFLGHVCMDLYKIGVKDGKATAHAMVNRK
jgi:hypothetical protein